MEQATENCISIPSASLDRLLGHCDGNAALLYLHILRAGHFSVDRASRELKCTETELLAAAAALRSLGLLETLEPSAPPEYTAEEVGARTRSDSAFQAVVAEAEQALGRVLSAADLKTLLGIQDFWGLPADVVMVLLNFCVDKCEYRYGPGRKPNMRFVETEAQDWSRHEIYTLEAAEERIRTERERRTMAARTAESLQIRGREPTPTERKYISAWLELGFGPESIAEAYDRTVVSTGKLSWKYMDSILRNWNSKGLHTPEEIAEGDPRHLRQGKRGAAEEERSDDEKLAGMRRMYAFIKGGES